MLDEAWAQLRRGDVYGVVLVPRDFAQDLKGGRAVELPAWYNAQYLTAGNVVARDLQTAVAGFGASVEARGRLARGETRAIASVRLNPVGTQRSTLFNPEMNYGPFLVTGIGAAILHIAAMLAAVRAVGRELRDGTAPAWLASAGGSRGVALAAKLAVPFAVQVTLGLGMLIAWGAGRALGLSTEHQAMLLVFGALPPAVLNYVFAERYAQEPDKVASIVMVGNVAALLFIPVALAIAF